MQKQIKIWRLLSNSIKQKIPAILLYVLESKGSSPGRQGFFMAVNANGDMEGSIGGGIMEHKFVEMAKDRLLAAGCWPMDDFVRKQVHDKKGEKDRSGMICSGEQTILIHEMRAEDLAAIESLIISLEKNENGCLHLAPGQIGFSNNVPEKDFTYLFNSEQNWDYKEKTGYKNILSIIGGGHCALAFSRLMSGMDFFIRVFDDRKDLKTMDENCYAHERIVIGHYSDLASHIEESPNHFVVIMTFGYRTDDVAIRALLNKLFTYIGVLGSKSKMDKLFDDYRQEGISEDLLKRIHTPIGLDIRSQTPEEIAVSIAAEIIKVKNNPVRP